MRIHINGNDLYAEHTRRFTHFFAKKFFTPERNKELSLKINFRPIRESDDIADCMWDNEDSNPPSAYTINFFLPEDTNELWYLRCLAHELTHLKQYALGELRYLISTNNEWVKFCGKRYFFDMYYWDRPWEIEAHGREKGLMVEYKALYNLQHISLKEI